MRKTCDLLVVTYNGLDLLKMCLPSVVDAADHATVCDATVFVIENGGDDLSADWVAERFPTVRFVQSAANDYLFSLNWAATRSSADLILILNNDVKMRSDSIDPLIEPLLEHDNVFSVSPKLLRFDHATYDAGKRWGEFRRGFLHHSHDPEIGHLAPTLFPTGAAFAVRRHEFLKLGGFSRLYYPAYWEDTELGYRAWKRGMANLWSPDSVMLHKGSASFDRLGSSSKKALHWRNSWLFTWHSVGEPRILAENAFWTARYYLSALTKRRKVISHGFHMAIRKLPEVIRARREASEETVLSDRAVCAHANMSTWPLEVTAN